MSAQLVFDLAAPPALGRDDFFVSSSNELAVRMLAAPEAWPDGKLLLIGPEGSGKSHLSRVWAEERGALVLVGADLAYPQNDLPAAVVVEDAHRVAGRPGAETALFHLHNRVLAAGGRLLLTGIGGPELWGVGLPDLRSRLDATARAVLDAPDDRLLAAVILKLFADRQVAVPPNVVPYVIARIDRSFAAARDFVCRIDTLALSSGRAVSRALAAEVLQTSVTLDRDTSARP